MPRISTRALLILAVICVVVTVLICVGLWLLTLSPPMTVIPVLPG